MGNADSQPTSSEEIAGEEKKVEAEENAAVKERNNEPTHVVTTARSKETLSELSSLEGAPRELKKRERRKKRAPNTTPRRNHIESGGVREDAERASSHITDDQVHVNLAMSDLMAYLQVVANNSTNLPVTRRDDPEQDRHVNTLSAEEYARKSAAFVPADVRMIGAVFTRYGRVWDLPTSQEFNACDGAQEPGRSYGGACSNALLKVLYDAANAIEDGKHMQGAEDEAALFDDDDEEEESAWGTAKSFKSGFSMDNNQTTISWADLLKKMKAEIRDIEYAQIPKLSTTRKLDLSQPFSLMPETFDPTKNKKRSLLIGCNYSNIPGAELKASHDDVRSMKDYIVNVHGFPETKGLMTVLLDDDEHKHPTFLNIVEAFKVLSEESHPGDAVFVQFSGHGGRVLDAPISDSYDETIVPCDYKASGLIRDTLIFKTLLAPMRYGVTVTVVIDCCDTGMILDLPYAWSTKSEKHNPKLTINDEFSFVRFLKVVKTLYETSTFTQLGKTVGSALGAGVVPTAKEMSESEPEIDVTTDKYKTNTDSIVPSQESILDAITDACRPATKVTTQCVGEENLKQCSSGVSHSKREDHKLSLFEQMLNCTLLTSPEEEYFSDEDDTYKTYEDGLVDESFDETASEEESEYNKRRGRSRRRNSQKR